MGKESGQKKKAEAYPATTKRGSGPQWDHLQLLVCDGLGARAISLQIGTTLIVGRDADADIVVVGSEISRHHASIRVESGGVTVTDLGSTNGVWSENKKVDKVELTTGIEVALGADVVLHLVRGIRARDRVALRDQFDALLREEADRAMALGHPLAVAMLSPEPSFQGGAALALPLVQEKLGSRDHLVEDNRTSLAVLLVGRDQEKSQALCREFVSVLPGHSVYVGLAHADESPIGAFGLVDLAKRRMQAADAESPLVVSGCEKAARGIVAESPLMKQLMSVVDSLAPVNLAVLIRGETGSGKEVIATEIHNRGPRSAGPLRTLNCAAIPAQLAESLLFGHEKGAFTGARDRRAGLFEQAEKGTVFLDEIGELPLELQAKLLRVLETRRVCRLGSYDEIPFDARVIAATHRDLEAMCEDGAFRQDLYYRINGVSVELPPLRERPEDIGPLAALMSAKAAHDNGLRPRPFAESTLRALMSYSWPGNVRELRNVVERATVLAHGEHIAPEDLPRSLAIAVSPASPSENVSEPASGQVPSAPSARSHSGAGEHELAPLDEQVSKLSDELLLAAYTVAEGNKTSAAALLDMPRRTFSTKVAERGIEERFNAGDRASDSTTRLVGSSPFREIIAGFEREILRDALLACDGNRSAAARSLSVPVHVLSYKAKKHGL